ncbi:hypothetical protein S83_035914 [Arachis hypogaea]
MIAASFSFPEQWLNRQQEFKQQQQPVVDRIVAFEGRNLLSDEANKENLESPEPSSSLIRILETEFECLLGYMKGLVTWHCNRFILDGQTRKEKSPYHKFYWNDVAAVSLRSMEESYTTGLPTSHLASSIPAVTAGEKSTTKQDAPLENMQTFPPSNAGGRRGQVYQPITAQTVGMSNLSIILLCKFFLLALVGITMMQNFVFTSISYNSHTLGSAMSNLTPTITFLLAIIFR